MQINVLSQLCIPLNLTLIKIRELTLSNSSRSDIMEKDKYGKREKTVMDLKRIVRIAMMAALIFAGTYTFKIPIAITGGYTHLGDCAIFVGVMLLGRKDGALAAALGAALSDLLSGAMLWVLPTFIIKGIMALIMGLAVEKLMPEHRYGWLIGEVLGGVCQIVGYQLVKIVLISPAAAIATIPTITMQTIAGIVIASVVITIMQSSNLIERLKRS